MAMRGSEDRPSGGRLIEAECDFSRNQHSKDHTQSKREEHAQTIGSLSVDSAPVCGEAVQNNPKAIVTA